MVFSLTMIVSRILKVSLLAFPAYLPQNSVAGEASGCDQPGLKSGTYTLDHGGLTRTYRIHVPAGYDASEPAPMVMLFHGWGGNEDEFLSDRTVRHESDLRGYIVVAPRGLGSGEPDNSNNSWSFSGSTTGVDGASNAICDDRKTPDYSYLSCANVKQNTCSWTQCRADDVAFSVALVREISSNLCIDENRIYASGGSNGGMFTWELGQNPASATVFSAIAPVIGLPHRGYLDGPGKQGKLPVLLITGTLDNVVPPGDWDNDSFTTTSNDNDRFYYTGATAITMSWAKAHGCDTSKSATPVESGFQSPDCRTWCTTDIGLPRVLDCRARMGHTYDLSWSWQLVMDFFDTH